jgi:ankyrin repeat protein
MRIRHAFSVIRGVILCLFLIAVVSTPHMRVRAEGNSGKITLLQAAKDGDTETVKALIERGTDVDADSVFNSTALMAAAFKGHTEIVQELLQAGADVNASAKNCDTALILAIEKGRAEVIEMLKKAGAQE